MESSGHRPVVRFRVERGAIVFDDIVHGRMNFDPEGIQRI
jgi:glutamyl/glutaminyl-tRNA synthetase